MTFVWMNYGRMVGDSTLQTVNTTGLILQGIYVFSFYSITSHKLQAGKKIFLTILLLFVIGMYIITAEDLEKITLNIGWLGATMSFAYCSAPLASIQEPKHQEPAFLSHSINLRRDRPLDHLWSNHQRQLCYGTKQHGLCSSRIPIGTLRLFPSFPF